jgi:DNA-binding transcriptional MocR family regulator
VVFYAMETTIPFREAACAPEVTDGATLYAGVADWIISCLDRGIYKVGDRVPSIRSLSTTLQVSINTVREAYDLLERRRYVECRPQSGYFVLKAPPPSIPERNVGIQSLNPREVVFCRICGEISGRGGSVAANLAVAMPDTALLPVKRLGAMIADAMRVTGPRVLEYCMTPGYGPLREQLARLSVAAGARLSPDEIVVTNGCCEALYLALMATCRPGDAVAVESPLYFNLFQMLKELDVRVLEIPSSPRDGINLDVLRFAMANHRIAACVVIPTFSNPTGACLPEARKRELVGMTAEAGIPLIEDDVHGELCHSGSRPPSCKSFDQSDNVLYCSSLTKTLGGGLRLGWIAPGRYRQRVERMKSLMNVGNATLEQMAVSRYLAEGHYERHLRSLRVALAERVEAMRDLVAESFPEGTRAARPLGGFLLWVEMPEAVDACALYDLCIRESIVFPPGVLFTASGGFGNFLRLNGSLSGPEPERVVRRIGELARTLSRSG